jgi:hypothetical protein
MRGDDGAHELRQRRRTGCTDYAFKLSMIRHLRVLTIAALTVAAPVHAQRSGPGAHPNVDKPFEVAPGDTVQLLSRLMHEAGPAMSRPGKRLDFVYSTSIPSSNGAGRAAQADKAAQALGAQAVDLGVNRISIGICDTKECAQRKHPPADWFLYQRTSSGWKRVP